MIEPIRLWSTVFLVIALATAHIEASGTISQAPQVEAWRKFAPPPPRARPFTLPTPREAKLDNGLTLVMIEDHRSPMVTISMGVPVGSIHDPAGLPGLAEATADLLTEGAGDRSAEQLARDVESLGGRLEASANDDYTEVSAAVVSENAERMLEIVGDVLLRPSFPESEVALYKSARVQNLTVQRQEPAFLVSEHFNRIIYGQHPYAISAPTPESIAATDRGKIAAFHRSNFTSVGSALVIVGDFNPDPVEASVRRAFSRWSAGDRLRQELAPMPQRAGRRVYLMDRPGSDQADFRIGNLAVARSDADYFPLLVASTILGGGTSSRLFLNIRERRGYAYDVYSALNAPQHRGTFFGASETRTEVTLAAIKEMLLEFGRLRAAKVTNRDLQNAKNYLNGVFSLGLSTQGGLADRILHSRMLDLPTDYLENYRVRVDSVTADQVRRAAREYILTDRPAIVVIGDAAKLKRQLRALGPTDVVDIGGKPLRPKSVSR